jgi:isopentenyldiphosphate isomerase
MAEQIAVVDEQNRFLRWEERRRIHEGHLLHRSIHVAVIDGEGRLLLQLRHRSKQVYPSTWDISCDGHVGVEDYPAGPDELLDEVYERAARRELAEELSLDAAPLFVAHCPPEKGIHYEQLRLFWCRAEGPLRPQEEEIEALRWVRPAEFDALRAAGEPMTRTLPYLAAHLRRAGLWGE